MNWSEFPKYWSARICPVSIGDDLAFRYVDVVSVDQRSGLGNQVLIQLRDRTDLIAGNDVAAE